MSPEGDYWGKVGTRSHNQLLLIDCAVQFTDRGGVSTRQCLDGVVSGHTF